MAVYNFKWDYDNATAYVENDTVKYNWFFYANVLASTWVPPTGLETDNANWGFVETPEIKVEDIPEKLTNAVPWDKVILAIDSEDGNKTKIMDQSKFVWPSWPPWAGWILQLTSLSDPWSWSINTLMVNSYDWVVITTTTTWVNQIIANPTDTTSWKTFLAVNATWSTDPISVNWSPLQVWEIIEFVWDWLAWNYNTFDLASKSLLGSFVQSWMEVTATLWGTTFDVAPWIAFIVDNYTNEEVPVITKVVYWGQTWIPITNIASSTITYITIDKDGNIWQTPTNTWGRQDRDTPRCGSVSHADLATVTSVSSVSHGVGWDIVPYISDLTNALWILIENDSDFAFSPASTDMTIARSAGNAFWPWLNRLDRKLPNNLEIIAKNPITNFLTTWRDGMGWFILNPTNSVVTSWLYDDDSTWTTTAPIWVVTNNKYVNHRLFYSPTLNLELLQYWQTTYNSKQNALNWLSTESFDKNPILNDVLFRWWLTLKWDATNLASTNNVFTTATKFGAVWSAWSTTSITEQEVYDNSAQPQVITDATRGAKQIQRWSALDTDTVFEILNWAWAVTFSVNGNWDIVWNIWWDPNVVKSPPFVGTASTAITFAHWLSLNQADFDDWRYMISISFKNTVSWAVAIMWTQDLENNKIWFVASGSSIFQWQWGATTPTSTSLFYIDGTNVKMFLWTAWNTMWNAIIRIEDRDQNWFA